MRAAVGRLEALTGLRFLAAAAVVVSHTEGLGLAGLFGQPRLRLDPDTAPGGDGVTFFFVLSGFILAYVYPRLDTPGEVGRFLLARFARLWPANLFGLALSMALTGGLFWRDPDASFHPIGRLVAHALMLEAWVPAVGMVMAYNPPAWSISAEFGFYLLFVPLVRNWAGTWWWKLPLTLVPPAVLVAVANARGLSPVGPPHHLSYEMALYFTPVMRVWQFALGMAACLLWQRLVAGRRVGVGLGTLLEVGAVGLAAAAHAHTSDLCRLVEGVSWLGPPARYLVYACGPHTAGPFAVLIVVFANRWGLLSRPLASRPGVLLGEASFGLYIVHWPLMTFLGRNPEPFRTLPPWAAAGGYWAVALGLAIWLHFCVERPGRRLLVGLWPKALTARQALGAFVRSPAGAGAAGTLVLAGLVVAAAHRAEFGTLRFVRPDRVDELVKFAAPGARDVLFGDCFLLRGATLHAVRGGVEVRAVWQTTRPQPPGCRVWVQGLESAFASREAAWTVDAVAPLPRGPLPAGWVWEHRVFVPAADLLKAPQVVLAVWNKDETGLLPVYAHVPENPFRLRLVPPPDRPAAAGYAAAGGR